MSHVQEPVNLTIYLYAQTMGQPRMECVRKFYIYNIFKEIRIIEQKFAWNLIKTCINIDKYFSITTVFSFLIS